MPFNGSGTYNPPAAPTFPAVPNTLIESTKFNNVIQDVATGLSTCITRDGQSTVTANIPFGGFKITGLGNGSLDTDAVAFGQGPNLRGGIGASDWDTLIKTGMYEATAASLTGPAANFPGTSDVGQLFVAAQGNTIEHLYITSNGTFTRQKTGAVWSSWTAAPTVLVDNITLNVPSQYATVRAAMQFLQQRTLGRGVTATIAIAAGTINEGSTPVDLSHPQGAQINITGAGTGSTIWNMTTAATTLWTLLNGTNFGTISALDMRSSSGLLGNLNSGSQATLTDIIIDTGSAFIIQNGSILTVNSSTLNAGAANTIFNVNNGSKIFVLSSTLTGQTQALGGCLVSYNTVTQSAAANTAVTLNTGSELIIVGAGSTIQLSNLGISSNSGSQIYVTTGLTLTVQNNTTFGIQYTNAPAGLGTISGAGNGSGLESAAIEVGAGQLTATTGDIRLTPGAGASVRLDATFTGAADAASTGYVEMKDGAGTTRRFMIRA